MSRRVHPTLRKLFGLAAAPGRLLSALEPESRVRPVLSAEPEAVEDAVRERLAPLLAPASVAQPLERALAKLGTGEAGEVAAAGPRVRRGEVELPSLASPERVRRRPVARAAAAAVETRRAVVLPERGVDARRLLEMAGAGVEVPSEAEPVRPLARPEAKARGPRLPSREEVRARMEQRARSVGAAAALETPVGAPLQAEHREVSEVLSRSLVSLEARRGMEAAPASRPEAPLSRPLERALERLEVKGPARSRVPMTGPRADGAEPRAPAPGGPVAGDGPVRGAELRGGLAGLAARAETSRAGAARAEDARNGLTGLAGLAARAASGAAPAPRARTESHPPPPLLANTALPSPAVPSVLAERMEEAKLTQRLERLLRREAERAGVSLEGLDP